MALMGLLPENAETTGSIRLDGDDLTAKGEREMCGIRGKRIGMIFQEPMTALNPVHSIGRQVAEPLRLHRALSADAARKEAIALLDRVGIPDAARRIDAYPHQFSGGQRQRITIAMALACGPELLIADEPTTALDVTIQRQILELIRDLVAERGMALILISHDLGVIAQNVARTMVMYGGAVVESGSTAAVFSQPMHPYTLGLFGARPGLLSAKGQRLTTIAGTVPELIDLPAGCPFAGRCTFTIPECNEVLPAPVAIGPGHEARCIRLDAVAASQRAKEAA
jgi:peptide/nickel transport system ATP-binding protein